MSFAFDLFFAYLELKAVSPIAYLPQLLSLSGVSNHREQTVIP